MCNCFATRSLPCRCSKSAQKFAVRMCQVATVVMETAQLVLSQFITSLSTKNNYTLACDDIMPTGWTPAAASSTLEEWTRTFSRVQQSSCQNYLILRSSGGTAESLRVGSENMENLMTVIDKLDELQASPGRRVQQHAAANGSQKHGRPQTHRVRPAYWRRAVATAKAHVMEVS